MENLLKLLIEPLVSDIKKVKIEKFEENGNFKYLISIPKEDIAKVIGKEGKMIKAIKNLVKIKAVKDNIYAVVEVQEA